jgi:hypothetical protein
MWIGLFGAAFFLIKGIGAFWFHTLYGRYRSIQVTTTRGEFIGTIFFATSLGFLIFAWRGFLGRRAETKEISK